MWWSICGKTRTILQLICFGDGVEADGLLTVFDVEEDDQLIVIEIDCVDEGVDHTLPEGLFHQVTMGEDGQPCHYLLFRDGDLLLHTQLGKVALHIDSLLLQCCHAFCYAGNKAVRDCSKSDDQLVQFFIDRLDGPLKGLYLRGVGICVVEIDYSPGYQLHSGRIKDVLDSLLADIPFDEALLLCLLLAAVVLVFATST